MSYYSSSHFSHRHVNAPTTYYPQTGYAQPGYASQTGYAPQPMYPQTGYAQPGYAPQTGYTSQTGYAPQASYIPSPPMAAPSYVNAQGVNVPSTYYDQMNASPILPPQYNEHAMAPSPYPMIDQHPSRVGGLKNHWKARISQKYHMYSDIPSGYAQTSVGGDSYLPTSASNPPSQQQQQQQQQQQYTSSPAFEDDLNSEYRSTTPQPLQDIRSSYANPPTVRTPGGFTSPQHPTPSFGASRERPRSLPHPIRPLTTSPPQATTPGPSRPATTPISSTTRAGTPSASRTAEDAPVPPPRPHHHHHRSSSGSSSSGNGTPRSVVAAIPTNMAHEERRQLAQNLLSEIDAYERMQNRVFLFRLLPPLRFRVTVVRNVDGRPQQTETMMTMSELRAQLQHALEHDSQMVDQLGMTYEQLVGLSRVQHGVKDVSVFPTFTYTQNCHVPSDKSTCSVCLADFAEGDVLKTVPCMHLFHTECIDEWLKMSKVCPVCKTCVEDESPVEDDDDCCKGKKQPVTSS